MRILLTNVRLEERAGSELYVADMARWLRDHGHQPVVYSARLGSVADEIRREAIPVVSDLAGLSEAPDIIHAQHHLATMSALATFPLVPAVAFCHGWIPWEESPARHPAIRRYVAVGQDTRERLVTEGGVPPDIVRVVPNFVDLDRFRPRGPLPERPRRALVFSNNAHPGGWFDTVQAACQERDIEVDVVGLGFGKPIAEPEHVLPAYDLVFAKGRSALEAMAVGAAVILCDVEGCGPLVTTTEFERLREGNFSHAVLRQPHIGPFLGEQIDCYDVAKAADTSRIVRFTLGRERVAPTLLELYEEAIAEVQTSPHTMAEARAAEQQYLRWLDHHFPRPVLDSYRALAQGVHTLEFERNEACSRATAAQSEAARIGAESERLRGETERLRTHLEELHSGFLVRAVLPRLWYLRGLLAPNGSLRYRFYRGALAAAQRLVPPRDARP